MTIGLIGAGHIGSQVARLAVRSGHKVVVSNSRGPETLADLVAELARRQNPDGSWVNENSRWLEGDPNLVTGYALLALTYSRPK